MSTNPELAEYLRTILSRLGTAEKKKMFDVFCFYINGKAVGFLVEDQALVKTNPDMRKLWPEIEQALLFQGAVNPMWVIEDLDDEDKVCELYGRALKYLPEPKAKARRGKSNAKQESAEEPDSKLPGSPLRDPKVMGKFVLSASEIKQIELCAAKIKLTK